MIRRLATLATAGALVLAPSAALAQEDPTPPPLREERVELMCARVPLLQLRTERLLERLPGGADEVGSIAWLRARAEQARGAGREQVATLLEGRADLLDEKLDVLPAQQEWLALAADWCAQRGATGPDEAA